MSRPAEERLAWLGRTFFLAGPTAVGKSELAAELAAQCGGEVIGADAFQIYEGMPILTAKPSPEILAKARHHLIGAVPASEHFNVARYAEMARRCICEVLGRGSIPIVSGGTGLYIRALTHGLSDLPEADPTLRGELEGLPLTELQERLHRLDPRGAASIDLLNPRRVIRALEICMLTGKSYSEQREQSAPLLPRISGVIVTRNREELYARINRRVEEMFENGVIGEAKDLTKLGTTASQVLGLKQIRDHVAGKLTENACIEEIRKATRDYAKRQLTWFKSQRIFVELNLSPYDNSEPVLKELAQKALSTSASPLDV